ncbi:hypothetical protein BZARG_768 [Bizionia argentinensis JUB59]|uniref:Uncharacterized protein n=1 Tax=Bizionia argentinensis JUB59 TaxID=1046627 RepID=G2EB85_9FLAO|nr:hypothetical protein BZARG_768 [Bizionia argentinensis JUB59]
MTKRQSQQLGTKKNKLLRYQSVLDYYHEIFNPDIPLTVLHSKYIYPRFFISRTTFYKILGTPVVKELKEIKAFEESQLSMF